MSLSHLEALQLPLAFWLRTTDACLLFLGLKMTEQMIFLWRTAPSSGEQTQQNIRIWVNFSDLHRMETHFQHLRNKNAFVNKNYDISHSYEMKSRNDDVLVYYNFDFYFIISNFLINHIKSQNYYLVFHYNFLLFDVYITILAFYVIYHNNDFIIVS